MEMKRNCMFGEYVGDSTESHLETATCLPRRERAYIRRQKKKEADGTPESTMTRIVSF